MPEPIVRPSAQMPAKSTHPAIVLLRLSMLAAPFAGARSSERLIDLALPYWGTRGGEIIEAVGRALAVGHLLVIIVESDRGEAGLAFVEIGAAEQVLREAGAAMRSEEHTSELQSLMRISYAVFCLKK